MLLLNYMFNNLVWTRKYSSNKKENKQYCPSIKLNFQAFSWNVNFHFKQLSPQFRNSELLKDANNDILCKYERKPEQELLSTTTNHLHTFPKACISYPKYHQSTWDLPFKPVIPNTYNSISLLLTISPAQLQLYLAVLVLLFLSLY